jgi:uncharacterized membrane protein YbhN (UPF0104 family)
MMSTGRSPGKPSGRDVRSVIRSSIWIVIGLVSVGGAGWIFAHYTGGFDRALAAAQRVPARRWLEIGALTIVFYSLDWFRYWTLFRLLGRPFPYTLGLRLVAVSYFVSSLTPSAELHMPVMVLLLVGRGYPVAEATAATVTKSIYMVMWVCVFGLIGLHVADDGRVPRVIDDHLALWLVSPSVIVGLLILVVAIPNRIHAWCRRRLARPDLPSWKIKVLTFIDMLPASLATIGRSLRGTHALAHLGCIAFVGVYVAIGHLLANGVGLAVDARTSYAAHSTGLLVSYVAPVPGSVGVTEAATAHLLDPAMSPDAMTAAILVRICAWYLGAIVGAVLLVGELRRIGWERFARALRKEASDADATR